MTKHIPAVLINLVDTMLKAEDTLKAKEARELAQAKDGSDVTGAIESITLPFATQELAELGLLAAKLVHRGETMTIVEFLEAAKDMPERLEELNRETKKAIDAAAGHVKVGRSLAASVGRLLEDYGPCDRVDSDDDAACIDPLCVYCGVVVALAEFEGKCGRAPARFAYHKGEALKTPAGTTVRLLSDVVVEEQDDA